MSEDNACRAAFEVDFCGNSLVLSARAAEGFYIHPLTDHRWKAYQAAWNRRSAPVAQGWISVKDRLPDTSQHVLLAIGQNVCIGFRSKCDEGLWVSEYGHHLKAPTYWMPRPVAPTPPAAPPEPPTIETLIERANATLGEFEVPKEPTE